MCRFAETGIVDNRSLFPIKENKLPFSISICSKQTEVCRFPFLICSKQIEVAVFHYFHFLFALFRKHGDIDMESWWSYEDMETWRHVDRDMETWRHRHSDMETWRNKETWRHGHLTFYENKINKKTENQAQAIFLNPFTVCQSCKRKLIVCPFVNEETNESCPFENGLNGLDGLAHLCLEH
jgi:hypothetical protein